MVDVPACRPRSVIACLILASVSVSVTAHARTLFVRAGAATGGDGSQAEPFGSLAAVERASIPGDEIVVLPAPLSEAPLNGGIALKPDQKLTGGGSAVNGTDALRRAPRITNTDPRRNSGDAVVLADGDEVSNLVIAKSARGGIYGRNVSGVRIYGNNLSGTNTSCTAGLYVYFPGNVPLLPNGWASIMIDESRGIAWLSIDNNYIHDGTCSDGIDIRVTADAKVAARVNGNKLTRLEQGPKMLSVLAIGMQTRNSAVLSVDSDGNSETYIGSAGADCEGLFANQAGGSLTWSIDRNTFAHGIGGGSCNGAEFYIGAGIDTANLYISHSTFEYDPGDMIEEDNNGGTGSVMNLTLDNVSVSHTSFPKKLPPEPQFTNVQYMDNLGRCMDQYSWGHRNVNNLRVIDSRFADCYGDGIGSDVTGGTYTFGRPTAADPKPKGMYLGDAKGDSVSIDVENSTIEDAGQYSLHFANHAAMSHLAIRVQNSRLDGAGGRAIVGIDQDGTTRRARIDLGGEGPGDPGRNCIVGRVHLAAEVAGYDVLAKSNWWGRPGGPATDDVSVTAGRLSDSPALRSPPPSCFNRP